MSNDTYKQLEAAIAAYRKDNPNGGTLHVTLEDGNVGNSALEVCRETARVEGDEAGERLVNSLLLVPEDERELMADHDWRYWTEQAANKPREP